MPNSSTQYSALCTKKSRTVRLCGPSKAIAAPQGVRRAASKNSSA